MSELGTMVMPEYDMVITFKDETHLNLPQGKSQSDGTSNATHRK
jgi:hypothetical protein